MLGIFIHQSSDLYGSDRVLLDLVTRIRSITPLVVLPEYGPLTIELDKYGVRFMVAPVGKISRQRFSPPGILDIVKESVGLSAVLKPYLDQPVAFVHSNTMAVLAGPFVARALDVPHVWHVHEIIRKPKLVGRLLREVVWRTSDLVIANSGITKRWLDEVAPRGKTSVLIHNGLRPDAASWMETREWLRASLGLTQTDVVIILTGRINWWKGHGLMISAFAKLASNNFSLRLVIVGDEVKGQEGIQRQLVSQARALGIASQVSFLGYRQDAAALMAACDIAVVPSIEPEPFGLVAIEAMDQGLPVVAAAHGGLLDIVVHDATGLLFSPGDERDLVEKLQYLISNRAQALEFGSNGRSRAREFFSSEAFLARFEDLYRSIVRSDRGN